MTRLTLNPAVAAARRAARETSMPTRAPIVAPRATAQAAEGVPRTEQTPPNASPGAGPNKHGRLKAELDALEAKLRRIWPHCFTEPVPLAVGIRYDIAKHLSADEQKLLPGVLHRWVKRNSYLKACVQPGACRVGLDGSLTPISPEQAAYAKGKLA